MWVNNLDPVILNLGFAEIRWYGVVYVLGFFFSLWWLLQLQKKGKLQLSKEEVWDFFLNLMLGVLLGSRLLMMAWDPQTYLFHPLNLLKFWEGGMSFHGGLVGITLAAYLYCRKKKISFLQMADLMSFPTLFALALGRIANFTNGELVGRVWNGSSCVIFPHYDSQCRHPYTLYAAGQRFLVSFWLLFLALQNKFKAGFVFYNFLLWEGLGRFFLDFFREDQLFFYLSLGQWFSLVMIIIALYFLFKNYTEEWKKIFKVEEKREEENN